MLAGPDGRLQAAQATLNLAEFIAAPCGHCEQACRPPAGDAGHEGTLGLRELAAEPLGHAQVPPGEGLQQPLAFAELGQGPLGERGRALGVTTELGEGSTMERDQRGDVHQHAVGPADSRLERLLARACGRALRRVEQRLHRLWAAAPGCQKPLRQQQPGTGPDQVGGERRQPLLDRRRFAAQTIDRVKVPLDQPGGPRSVPGSHRMPDCVIGQLMLLAPGRSVAVQLRHPGGLLVLQAGAQQVGEQVMVAPPAAHLIQRHQEQARPLHLLQ